MMRKPFFNLFLIFLLCFGSFLLGWAMAVYILPGGSMANKVTSLEEIQTASTGREADLAKEPLESDDKSKMTKVLPFFEELKENILLLFNPYQMDSALREATHLDSSDSYIKKSVPDVKARGFKDNRQIKGTNKTQPATSSVQDNDAFSSQGMALFIEGKGKEGTTRLKEIQAKYDKQNREQLVAILESQNIFKLEGKFSFLVNVFSDEKQALEYVQKMKIQFPLWSFLIKTHSDHIRIYLGPMTSKSRALEFKNTLSETLPFSLDFLEEVSL